MIFFKDLIPSDFYLKDTTTLAQKLLGKILVRHYPNHSEYFKIVETEAYLGLKDPSCHSFGGKRTPRVAHMYLQGGACYVYHIYGMYYCLNIVSRDETKPEAVLIRALEPLNNDKRTMGPGLLCQSLGIDKSFNGLKVYEPESALQIFEPSVPKKEKIVSSERIGLSHEDAKLWKLRFFIKDNPFVSRKK